MKKNIFIFTNNSRTSKNTEKALASKLNEAGFTLLDNFSDNADLLICIGGDGTFLEAIHKYGFPQMPIIGVNTGHLGFFQEIMPAQMDDFINNYSKGLFTMQPLSTVKIKVESNGETYEHIGLNEILIRGTSGYNIHLNMSIGGSFIERFSGDGLLVATPAGSTAYNYSLGGSIVDPRLNLLQVTPMAPMNTTAYRAFTSSILLPAELSLGLIPDVEKGTSINVVCDGYITEYDDIENMEIGYSDTKVNLIRFEGYDFWNKVKTKFL